MTQLTHAEKKAIMLFVTAGTWKLVEGGFGINLEQAKLITRLDC